MESYSQSVEIKGTKEAIFEALTLHIDKWWGEIDMPINRLGNVFKVSFGEAFWVFKVIEIQKNWMITWECVESNQVHAGLKGIKEEWLGTKLHWNITSKDEQIATVDFLHQGLVPSFNCYEVCVSAWDFFITESLRSFIEEGVGKPEKK